MGLLKTIIIIVLAYYTFKFLLGDVYQGMTMNWDLSDNVVAHNVDTSEIPGPRKCGGCDGTVSTTSLCGWNNSVSSDGQTNWAPESLKGTPRIYKYPHYYGYGTPSGFHYGEPYYIRTVDY